MYAMSLVLGGIGAILGGIITCSDTGKKVNDNMNDAFDLFDKRASKYIPSTTTKLLDK